MEDMYALSIDQILDTWLSSALGSTLKNNAYLQEALSIPTIRRGPLSRSWTPSTRPALHVSTRSGSQDGRFQHRIDHLEGWVEQDLNGSRVGIRAYGSRQLHIVAGNGPVLGALTIIRGAVTARHDRQGAVERSLHHRRHRPHHGRHGARSPVTSICRRLLAAARRGRWKPHSTSRTISRNLAWGGFASVKARHKYIQPGIELSARPKSARSIVGPEALDSEKRWKTSAAASPPTSPPATGSPARPAAWSTSCRHGDEDIEGPQS